METVRCMSYVCCCYVCSLLNNSRLVDLCKLYSYYAEPLYMRENPIRYFFNTKADCCEVRLINNILCSLLCLCTESHIEHIL